MKNPDKGWGCPVRRKILCTSIANAKYTPPALLLERIWEKDRSIKMIQKPGIILLERSRNVNHEIQVSPLTDPSESR